MTSSTALPSLYQSLRLLAFSDLPGAESRARWGGLEIVQTGWSVVLRGGGAGAAPCVWPRGETFRSIAAQHDCPVSSAPN